MKLKGLVWITMVMAFCLDGCGVMYLNAPPNSNIRLLGKHEKAEIKVERHAWFKFWGAQPMNPDDVNASKIIGELGLKEARIQATNTLVDGIYSIVPGMLGFPRRTLIIEGNRTLHSPQGIPIDARNDKDISPYNHKKESSR